MIRILRHGAYMSTNKLHPETTYRSIVGQVIVNIRKKLGFDQASLSNAVGVTQSTWSRIERGESPLTIDQLIKASEYLRIRSSVILSEAEQAMDNLKKQGVIVRLDHTPDKKSTNGIAMIGAAALGALVGAAIAKSSDSDK